MCDRRVRQTDIRLANAALYYVALMMMMMMMMIKATDYNINQLTTYCGRKLRPNFCTFHLPFPPLKLEKW